MLEKKGLKCAKEPLKCEIESALQWEPKGKKGKAEISNEILIYLQIMDQIFKNIEQFKFENVPLSQHRQKWLEYKRSFTYAANLLQVNKKKKLKSLFLTLAGPEVQRLYENLNVEENLWTEEDETEQYEDMMQALDQYFAPKQHDTFERFTFWNLQPAAGEHLDKFINRAKTMANCKLQVWAKRSREPRNCTSRQNNSSRSKRP